MKIVRIALIAALITGTAGPAIADPGTRAVFSYHTDQPIEQIYNSFQSTAHRACRSDSRILSIRYKEQRMCEQKLLDQAIRQTAMPQLTALHRSLTGAPEPVQQFASKE